MDSYVFKLAKKEDTSKILEFYHSLIGTSGCTWNLDYPNEDIVNQDIINNSLYLLKENDVIISVAVAGIGSGYTKTAKLKWSSNNPCDLARFGVLLSKQNCGIGSFMLNKVITAVKERGFDGIQLLVDKLSPTASALYDKNGFVQCGETQMDDTDFYCYEMVFDIKK